VSSDNYLITQSDSQAVKDSCWKIWNNRQNIQNYDKKYLLYFIYVL